MIRDFIKITVANFQNSQANELVDFISQMRRAYELGVRIRAKMKHNFDDTDPQNIVWIDLETAWGLPTGKGMTVFTLMDGAVGSMEGVFKTSAARDITETVG